MISPRLNILFRHRASLADLGIVLAVVLVATFVAWQTDIFITEDHETNAQKAFELNEVLLVGGILAVGLLIYSVRRLVEQKRETRRRTAAERHARELAYQDGLTGLANRRQYEEALQVALDSPPGAG